MTKPTVIKALRLSPFWKTMPDEEKNYLIQLASASEEKRDDLVLRAMATFQKQLRRIYMQH